MVEILERAIKKHAQTTFIACHLANLDYDLTRLAHCSTAIRTCMPTSPPGTPRPLLSALCVYAKDSDRLLYGTPIQPLSVYHDDAAKILASHAAKPH
jgi:hypothetical protein